MAIYDKVREDDVLKALASRGYGIDHRHGAAFGLNQGTGLFRKADGAERRKSLGAISISQMQKIMTTSASVSEAADRVISVCSGDGDPGPTHRVMRQEDVDALAEKKAQEMLARMGLTPQMMDKIREMAKSPADQEDNDQPPQKKKRRGRKKSTELTEKEITAMELRDKGLVYRLIAEQMGVSIARAQQLVQSGKRKVKALSNGHTA